MAPRPVALASLLLGAGLCGAVRADGIKIDNTPCFWQHDPYANFGEAGRNYCAPSSISDGLVYLQNARGLSGLVTNTDHDGQAALIKELAVRMDTNATGTGTNDIVDGLLKYTRRRGYALTDLEVATWGKLSERNKKYRISIKPQLNWMAAVAKDPDIVQVFGFGWYKKGRDGKYTRRNGHWVNVVGSGPCPRQFDIHNPSLEPNRQKTDSLINFRPVEKNFLFPDSNGRVWNMSGYYQAEGPGLPFNKQNVSAAVLESVLVFKIQRRENLPLSLN